MEPVVHTPSTFFSTFLLYKLPLSLPFLPKDMVLPVFLLVSTFFSSSSLSALTVKARSKERKQMSTEKMSKDITVEEVEDEEEEEEDESGGGGLAEEDEKKKGSGVSGRRGSSGGGRFSSPFCQAESCGADLTVAKRYHRRHKVCEFHSKAPVVVVAGLRQRFCQQCSRFHELAEFDETKRSCRRRLARHNERRRKSNAETFNEGCSSSKEQHPMESHCINDDDWGMVEMDMARSSGYKSFHIR